MCNVLEGLIEYGEKRGVEQTTVLLLQNIMESMYIDILKI